MVFDTENNEDLTRITLPQMISKHVSKGYELLVFLKNIIYFYDHRGVKVFKFFLIVSLDHFLKNQRSMYYMFTEFSNDVYKYNQQMLSIFLIIIIRSNYGTQKPKHMVRNNYFMYS